MLSVTTCPLPEQALLSEYEREGVYTDCFRTEIDAPVNHAQYVEAFYTSWLFRLERLILKWLMARPSSDFQAQQMARGNIDRFAAWKVENRDENQLLLCDFRGRTRSWLMLSPAHGQTRLLYFGSAVVPPAQSRSGFGPGFGVLLRFHQRYSVLLLHAARARLAAQHRL